MFKLFTKIFGSKYERDVKAYSPIVEIINEFATQYQSLTNDELRNKTAEFQDRIKESLKEIDAEIATLRQDAEETLDFNLKEELYKELDEAIKTRDKDLEEVLRTLLPPDCVNETILKYRHFIIKQRLCFEVDAGSICQ